METKAALYPDSGRKGNRRTTCDMAISIQTGKDNTIEHKDLSLKEFKELRKNIRQLFETTIIAQIEGEGEGEEVSIGERLLETIKSEFTKRYQERGKDIEVPGIDSIEPIKDIYEEIIESIINNIGFEIHDPKTSNPNKRMPSVINTAINITQASLLEALKLIESNQLSTDLRKRTKNNKPSKIANFLTFGLLNERRLTQRKEKSQKNRAQVTKELRRNQSIQEVLKQGIPTLLNPKTYELDRRKSDSIED